MDLTAWLLRRTVPCAFVVTAIGGTGARLAVEGVLREQSWRQALSPAEADVLVVCGHGDSDLDEALDRVWAQMPGPRACARVNAPGEVRRALDVAHTDLLDVAAQRHDADERDRAARAVAAPDEDMPGGLPMADRGEDRDGLKLDQLHLALGPALPDWPAGLSLRTVIQGDVVQEAHVFLVGAYDDVSSFWDTLYPEDGQDFEHLWAAASALDSAQRLLSVAGWPAAALSARRLRDALLEPEPGPGIEADLRRWLRGVRRSRLLRWSLRGLGEVGDGVPVELSGDAADRCSRWLERIEAATGPGTAIGVKAGADTNRSALGLIPDLVVGQELASARLIVASLDPDTAAMGSYDPARGT